MLRTAGWVDATLAEGGGAGELGFEVAALGFLGDDEEDEDEVEVEVELGVSFVEAGRRSPTRP